MKRLVRFFGGSAALAALLAAGRIAAAEFSVDFGRGRWDRALWNEVKLARKQHIGAMDQESDHIVNRTPPELSAEEVFRKYGSSAYGALLTRRKFSGFPITICAEVSFDHRMAPEIILVGEPVLSADGTAEVREYFGVVLFDRGINVWYYGCEGGKPLNYLVCFTRREFLPKRRYELKLTVDRSPNFPVLTVECGGAVCGFRHRALPAAFHAGVLGSEGRARFYNFKVKTAAVGQ